jgi:enamine deaminase RidA (YjgF/YER057c/UK114 family)
MGFILTKPKPREGDFYLIIQRLGSNGRYSMAVVIDGGVHTAGITARETHGTTVEQQTADVLAQIDQLLAEAGSSRDKLISVNIWLKDIGDYDRMNSVWDKWISPTEAPARATVGAPLADEGILVEIMARATL